MSNEELSLSVGIPESLLDELARRVAQKLADQDDGFLTGAKEIAAFLGCSTERIYNARDDDPTFPAFRNGGRLVASKSALREWLEANRR